jgi:hypothetical protein
LGFLLFGDGSAFGFFALFAGETSCDTRATRSGEAGARRGSGSMDTSTARPSNAVGPRARANKLGDGAGAHFATSILFVTAFLSLSSFGGGCGGVWGLPRVLRNFLAAANSQFFGPLPSAFLN